MTKTGFRTFFIFLCMVGLLGCRTSFTPQEPGENQPEAKKNVAKPRAVQFQLMVSRNGPPALLAMEIHPSIVHPKCEIYRYDAEVYLSDQRKPLYKESKIIKLVERKCRPCLPPGPPHKNHCNDTDQCKPVRLYPILSTLNFDVMPYFKSKTELRVKFKNFKGIRKLNDIPAHMTGMENASRQNQKELLDCENEIQDLEKVLNLSDLHILITS